MSRFYCSGLSLSMVCRARVTHVAYELGMEELLVARNAGIDSTCRRFETGKAEEDLNPGGGGVLPYKGLMGTCGQLGYVFRDFCLKQGIEFIIFCLNQGIDLSIFVLNRMSFLGP